MKYEFFKYKIPNDHSSLILLKKDLNLKDNFAVDEFLNKEPDVSTTLGSEFEFDEWPSGYTVFDYEGKARYKLVAQRTYSDILNEALFNPDLLTMTEAKVVITTYRNLINSIKNSYYQANHNGVDDTLLDIKSSIEQTEFHLVNILKRLTK